MALLKNHPVKITLEKGWLRKKLTDVVVTNYTYSRGQNDSECVIEVCDDELNILDTYSVPLSMRQLFTAQSDHMESGEVLDLTAPNIPVLQETYAKLTDQPLREGHVKKDLRMRVF